ncbi:MAG: HAD family hydrolase [Hyphomicrobiales bacterium]
MPAIETVVFDVGNVLLDWNPRHLYRKLFADEERMEWFLANICTSAWNLEQDRGRSFAEAVAELTSRHPEWTREIRAFDDRWAETVAGEIAGSVELLSRLKVNGVPIYAITNFSREKFAEALSRFAFLRDFEGVVVSGDEGLLKPDAAIYRLFLARYGKQASRCLFIDDSARNVEGARRVGMQALRFLGPAELARDLASFGMLEGPRA